MDCLAENKNKKNNNNNNNCCFREVAVSEGSTVVQKNNK